jgi:hypothetical protein
MSTHHYAAGNMKYVSGRGWVVHCSRCSAPQGTGDHWFNDEFYEVKTARRRRELGQIRLNLTPGEKS